jgi:hypothetical protein
MPDPNGSRLETVYFCLQVVAGLVAIGMLTYFVVFHGTTLMRFMALLTGDWDPFP